MSSKMDQKYTLLNILQLCDSAFPTGGFSHSVGFESAAKHGCVVNRDKYIGFVAAVLENTGSKLLPFVVAAYEGCGSVCEVVRLDRVCEACVNNHVENRASSKQGRSFTETAAKTFHDIPILKKFSTDDNNIAEEISTSLENSITSENSTIPANFKRHLPVMFGAVCGNLNISLDDTLNMFMFNTLKTVITASVRLGHTGTLEAQKIQYDIQKGIPDVIRRYRDIGIDNVHTRFPLVDIVENVHDTMFAKLFYS